MNYLSRLDPIDPLSRGALRHDVVRRLLLAIFEGELPARTRLVASRLAERLGVSATPIREALVELEQVGVVQLCHNRGALVKPFGREQLKEIFQLRGILESEAARCACGKIDPAKLVAIKLAMESLVQQQAVDGGAWLQQTIKLDRQLHGMIADHCGNQRLADEIHRYQILAHTAQEVVCKRRPAYRPTIDKDHLPMINAMLAGDPDGAAQAMARHLGGVGPFIESVIFPSDSKRGNDGQGPLRP